MSARKRVNGKRKAERTAAAAGAGGAPVAGARI